MNHQNNGRRPEVFVTFVGITPQQQSSIEYALELQLNQVKWHFSSHNSHRNIVNVLEGVIFFQFSETIAEAHLSALKEIKDRNPLCVVILTVATRNHRAIKKVMGRKNHIILPIPLDLEKVTNFLGRLFSKH